MPRKIIFSHGDKGGVGKSVVAAVLVDLVLQRFGKAGLIDGDLTTADVKGRYLIAKDVVETQSMALNLSGDASTAVGNLSVYLQSDEAKSCPVMIVNLPANAGETLDEHAKLLLRTCERLGFEPAVCYSIGTGNDAAAALQASLEKGLMSLLPHDNRMVVYPEMFGKLTTFVWYTMDGVNRDYRECVMPRLEPAFVADQVFKTVGPFSWLKDGGKYMPSDFGPYQEIVIEDWMEKCADALEIMLPEPDPEPVTDDGAGHADDAYSV